ncbi:MAG TPA: enoyl-CoA hydratase family protein [Polyangia bacterium]|jgi:enoyl-CoA hydratase/carnithine racemase
MPPTTFLFQQRPGGVAVLTLNRPARLNALTFDVYRELHETFRALQDLPDVRALVITGAGKGFCSGGDINEVVEKLTRMPSVDLLRFTRLTGQVVLAMRQLRTPIVAAINGAAVGGGAVIALGADIRLASENARIGFVFPRLGLCGADMGASWLLPRIIGAGRAAELLLTGEVLDAYAADKIGLVNRVVPDERLQAEAEALAVQLAAGPSLAHGMTKEMLNREAHMDLASAIEAEAQAQQICLQSRDFREAYQAVARRRPPKFEGR